MEELLLELGIGDEDAQRAATGLLRAAGSGEGQGVSVASFLQFYRQVGGWNPKLLLCWPCPAGSRQQWWPAAAGSTIRLVGSTAAAGLCLGGSMEGRGVSFVMSLQWAEVCFC